MSYLVLARKYRPMFFEEVIGQQHVTRTLQNAIEQKRIANAYLFSGPRGVGKTTVARILAKALNCEKGPSITPCNVCSSCMEINESRSLDVFEIDGASNRGIDEVRNLRESLRYSPNPGKYRINIIDEVHMLTNEAFNALLKTLEEPPKNVLFIFATTESNKVPATILSRCQRFDFKRITNKMLIEQLQLLCERENIQIDEESLRHIASKGDGSMRDSESILDQIIAYAGQKITSKDVENLLGIINIDLFFKVTELIIQGDVPGGVDLAGMIFIEGYDFNEFLMGLAEHFRNILVMKSTKSAEILDLSDENARRYKQAADAFEVEDLLRLIKIASDAEYLIRKSSNARLHMEVALVKMVRMNKSVTISQLFEKVEELKKKADFSTPGRISEPAPEPMQPFSRFSIKNTLEKTHVAEKNPEAADSVELEVNTEITHTLEDIEKEWPSIINIVKKERINVGSCLMDGWPIGLHGKVLELSFNPKSSFQMSTVERNRDILQDILEKELNVKFKIKCTLDENNVHKEVRKTPPPVDKKSDFEEILHENKILKNIVDTFDTELID